jgi:hypothetical protein
MQRPRTPRNVQFGVPPLDSPSTQQLVYNWNAMSNTAIHLDRLLEPLVRCLSAEVAAKVANLKADEAMQLRIDYLAERSNEGVLTATERDEYAGFLHAIDVIAILQAKARALLRKPT